MTEKIKIAQGKEKGGREGEMRQHNKKSRKVGEKGDPTKGKEKGSEGGGMGLKTCTKQGKIN